MNGARAGALSLENCFYANSHSLDHSIHAAIPGEKKNAIRWVANIFALGGFLISLPLVPWFWAQRMEPGFKFMEGTANNWIPTIGSTYNLGIDSISFLLIMLTTLL